MAPAQLVGPFPPGADPEAYDRLRRRVLWSMPSGLYLLGTRAGDRRNLMTLNWATQLSLDPKLVGVSVEVSALSNDLLRRGGRFTLSLLDREDRVLVRKFVKPAAEDVGARTLAGVAFLDSPVTGAPVPASALAYLDCRLRHELACGSHTLFVGEVVDAAFNPGRGGGGGPGADGEDGPGDGLRAAESGEAGEGATRATGEGGEAAKGRWVLRMEDTRMSYGG